MFEYAYEWCTHEYMMIMDSLHLGGSCLLLATDTQDLVEFVGSIRQADDSALSSNAIA